nr:immunoglobulin light chain junction region [Macaca mulatta]MOW37178.1 immunoglobulin light chain junction region [Macaca mulatta]MOW38536.1 immunoglobulin light chain junction region [Macaca mulatta]MOW38650.1 immunoglobulin light chain junction region [Macaca mulatta]MOW38665.1 immunoglobulin light chain junction region [Macaca mulatta]
DYYCQSADISGNQCVF